VKEPSVVGIGGSLAPISSSLTALKIAMNGASSAGARTVIFDVRTLNLPFYAPGLEAPKNAVEMCEEIYQAEGLIWSSPMYHGTISGSFKNAIDWFQLLADRDPPYLQDKVVGLISTAGGVQGLQAVNTMEFIVRALRGWAVPLVIPIPNAMETFDGEGRARDPKIEGLLDHLGREVVRAARQFTTHGYCDYSHQASAEVFLRE